MWQLGYCTGAASSVLTPGGEAWLQMDDQQPHAVTYKLVNSVGVGWSSLRDASVKERKLPTTAFDIINATL